MRLEGTLDAFSLPDIFQLLSYTKKTGTLHLRRESQHGAVHLRDGAVIGGRGDVARQALGRRLVGAGLVDDTALADAAEKVLNDPALGLGKLLVDAGAVPADVATQVAVEQASDAVFELLRWPDGEFAFVMDEGDPDDVGAALAVEDVVAEGTRRMAAWSELADTVPSLDAVVAVLPSPDEDPVVSRDEWSLLALVNGARTVGDLVALAGTGEFVVVSALAGLADRGLVAVGGPPATEDPQAQRLQLLSALEGRPVALEVPQARPAEPPPQPPAQERRAVIPERPEPFVPPRQPQHAEPVPAFSRYAAQPVASSGHAASAPSAPVTAGAHALATDPVASSYIDRDPAVNKSLLLRLIAGVRGL